MVKKIAIGCDHGGFALKEFLKKYLAEGGYKIEDLGSHSAKPSDYPIVGFRVAENVSMGKSERGILICKTGIGMAIAANKVRNVRSGVCNSVRQAKTSRLHNDTNVLALAAKFVTSEKAKRIVNTWLKTAALGGRHGRRVNQIKRMEKRR